MDLYFFQYNYNEGFEGSSLEIVRLSDSNSIVRFHFLLVQEVKFLQKLLLYLQFFLFFLARQIYPDLNFSFEETNYEGKKVVVLTIPAARTVPTSFDNERFIRIGSSKESLRKYPEKELYLFDVLRHGFPTIENTPSKYQD